MPMTVFFQDAQLRSLEEGVKNYREEFREARGKKEHSKLRIKKLELRKALKNLFLQDSSRSFPVRGHCFFSLEDHAKLTLAMQAYWKERLENLERGLEEPERKRNEAEQARILFQNNLKVHMEFLESIFNDETLGWDSKISELAHFVLESLGAESAFLHGKTFFENPGLLSSSLGEGIKETLLEAYKSVIFLSYLEKRTEEKENFLREVFSFL